MGDGNCLYRTLSHIIFGTETFYDQLKYKMIGKFRGCSEQIMNVMHMSGITCEQELVEHLDQITLENEWKALQLINKGLQLINLVRFAIDQLKSITKVFSPKVSYNS